MKMPATPSHQNRSVLTTLISRFRPQNSGSKLRRRTQTCLLGVCGLPPGNSADPVGIAEPYHDNTLGLPVSLAIFQIILKITQVTA
jgi:hypothetical protein